MAKYGVQQGIEIHPTPQHYKGRTPAMPTISNISCYKFTVLNDLKALREDLLSRANALNLKGTILISTEGINMFVAGLRENVDTLVSHIRTLPGLEDLAPKYSDSDEQPFRRMLVRIKKEIIAFGVEGVNPALRTSPKLKAAELKQWLDEGRPLTLLDTRNDYEVKLGTFRNALPIGVDHFRDFPDAVRKLPPEMKDQPIVMFCTGGIRCEKAGPFMEMEGFKNIYQLDGGILKYFEEVGGDHYDGECFVFDQRVGVDAHLHETESVQCFVCQSPLTADEQDDERYVMNASCPYCFKTTEQQREESVMKRMAALRAISHPLPGSAPYDNFRPLNVPEDCDGKSLLEVLTTILPQVPPEQWLRECDAGQLLDLKRTPVPASRVMLAGDQILHRIPDNVEPPVNVDIMIVHEDEALIVVNKPAPLPMHPGGRFNRNTLQWLLNEVYNPQRPRPAHRLDADTTGIVILARTAHFAKRLQPQFTRGEVSKRYLLKVHGHPTNDEFECRAPVGVETEGRKVRVIDEVAGQEAHTLFRVVRRHDDGTALLEAFPTTGRTNQIRLHAWHMGHPIVGDRAYQLGLRVESVEAARPGDPPLCLHAESIHITHPITNQRMHFSSPSPSWAA